MGHSKLFGTFFLAVVGVLRRIRIQGFPVEWSNERDVQFQLSVVLMWWFKSRLKGSHTLFGCRQNVPTAGFVEVI